jgi:hypothetical protein
MLEITYPICLCSKMLLVLRTENFHEIAINNHISTHGSSICLNYRKIALANLTPVDEAVASNRELSLGGHPSGNFQVD